jgi:hypothetical protein
LEIANAIAICNKKTQSKISKKLPQELLLTIGRWVVFGATRLCEFTI